VGGKPAANEADSVWLRWRSSLVAELGREEDAAESRRSEAQSTEKDEEVLPLESREELEVEVESDAEAEDVDAEDSSSVRTMEMCGDSCSGRSWPLLKSSSAGHSCAADRCFDTDDSCTVNSNSAMGTTSRRRHGPAYCFMICPWQRRYWLLKE
jgi:hypothetical protein